MEEKKISSSIQKDFRRQIWAPFCQAVEQYRLIEPDDRIAVCYSGGKDSSLLACCIRDYHRYSGIPFSYEILMLNPGYEESVYRKALQNAEMLGIPPTVVPCSIFEATDNAPHSPCHICAAMRRGYLYKNAEKAGCNKIALGHHMDDVAETVLMSMLYGGQYKGMMPKLQSDSYPAMKLIRPLYLIREQSIISWAESLQLMPISCACQMTRRLEPGARARTKALIRQLEAETPNIVGNIFGSLSHISLDTVLRYRTDQNSPWVDRFE